MLQHNIIRLLRSQSLMYMCLLIISLGCIHFFFTWERIFCDWKFSYHLSKLYAWCNKWYYQTNLAFHIFPGTLQLQQHYKIARTEASTHLSRSAIAYYYTELENEYAVFSCIQHTSLFQKPVTGNWSAPFIRAVSATYQLKLKITSATMHREPNNEQA